MVGTTLYGLLHALIRELHPIACLALRVVVTGLDTPDAHLGLLPASELMRLLADVFLPVGPLWILCTAGCVVWGGLLVSAARDARTALAARSGSTAGTGELLKARRMQLSLFPRTLRAIGGTRVAARSEAAMMLGGDYYDIIPLRDGRFAVVIGDVAGTGVAAALLMSNLQAGVRLLVPRYRNALEVLTRELNLLIWGNSPPEMFATFFVGVIDPSSGAVTYVNAGHERPILLTDAGASELSEGGLLLGVMPEAVYRAGHAVFTSGDLLVLYSDGLALALNGATPGGNALDTVLRSRRGESPETIVGEVFAEAGRGAGRGDGERDDRTLVVLELAATPAPQPSVCREPQVHHLT
jgi:serine phosphatase RsbU (regulator of sigma subunit)